MAKILVMEDNEMNWDIMSIHLEKAGHEAIHARNGKLGIELAASEQPALIIMDMNMPVMSGWEAAQLLKGEPATGSIPIIAVTGYSQPEELERIKEVGCDEYAVKPINYPEMLKTVENLLQATSSAQD